VTSGHPHTNDPEVTLTADSRYQILVHRPRWTGQTLPVAALGISVGAVKARLHQARSALTPALTPLITTPKEPAMTATAHAPAWADVFVAEIRRNDATDLASQAHVMILAEHNGPRQLPI
jgi:hypothetical protein